MGKGKLILKGIYEFKEKIKGSDDLSTLRDSFFSSCLRRVRDSSQLKRFYVINGPTGIGKTLTNLAVASIIADRIEEKYGKFPRIFYALPFTSIGDQVYHIFSDILGRNFEVCLLHHYEATSTKKGKSYRGEIEDYLSDFISASMWAGDIIVTTFEQVLYSILWKKKSFSKRFSLLNPSVVILDEVQEIPSELLSKIREGLRSSVLTYYVVSTATMPRAIIRDEEACEISSFESSRELCRKICPRILKRVRYFSSVEEDEKEKTSIEGFISWSKELISEKDGPYIFLLNTIESSVKVGRDLKKEAEKRGIRFYYLSSRVIPKERRRRIEEIKNNLKTGENFLLVTTQVIEAGVDISSRIMVRDLGPVEAIIQAAGRCNRNLEYEYGEVYIRKLFKETERGPRAFSNLVYNPLLIAEIVYILRKAKDRSSEYIPQEVLEEEMNKKLQDVPKDVSSQIEDFCEKIRKIGVKEEEVQIVKEKYEEIPIFIETDDEASQILERIEETYEKVREGKREEISLLKAYRKRASLYLINLPAYLSEQVQQFIEPFPSSAKRPMFYLMKKEELGAVYEETFGLVGIGAEEDSF